MAEAMKAEGFWPGCWYDNNRVARGQQHLQRPPGLAGDGWKRQAVDCLNGTATATSRFLDASVPAVGARSTGEDAAKFPRHRHALLFHRFFRRGHGRAGPVARPHADGRRSLAAGPGGGASRVSARGSTGSANKRPPRPSAWPTPCGPGIDSGGNNKLAYGAALCRWFMNRRLLLCDPDAWLPLNHALEFDRDWGSWLALTGSPMTIGADFRKLTPQREANDPTAPAAA